MEKITARRYQRFQYEMEPQQSDKLILGLLSDLEKIAYKSEFSIEKIVEKKQRINYALLAIKDNSNLIASVYVNYVPCNDRPVSHKDRGYVKANAQLYRKNELTLQIEELLIQFDSHWFWKYF